MGTPRLKGRTLQAARAVASTRPLSDLLWGQIQKDHGISKILTLPENARRPIDVEARPIAGAPPRQWNDAGLDAPKRKDGGTASHLRSVYWNGKITPLDVLQQIEERLERRSFGEATHSPFTDTDMDRARESAKESSKRWQKREPLGPLDGIPVPVKDEHDMVGLVTRGGTRYLTRPATRDSFCVRQLLQGGALVYAKTHTTEWGMSPVGFNPHYSMPRNVYSSAHAPGGSSTGSAVAVGLGLAPVAVGSDGGSSIRCPAALNGLFGIKPTYIRVGRTGDIFAHSTVSHIGPIGQSTADLVDFLEVTASNPDPEDPVSTYAPDLPDPCPAWKTALGRGVKGCRIGIDESEWAEADPSVARLGRDALKALEREGAQLIDVSLPLARHASAIGAVVIVSETLSGLFDDFRNHGAEMGDDLRMLLHLAERLTARDYFAACCTRAALRRDMAALMEDLDLFALPSTATVAPSWPLEDDRIGISDDGATRAMVRYSFLGNLTGLPAGSVPVGQHMGLPVGLMLMGDAWDEASVLAAMAHCERIGISDLPRPPGWASLGGDSDGGSER